jgi:predicted ATPase
LSDVTHGLVARDLPEGVNLRDLGEHRLKDLAHSDRLFQVVTADLPADFPAIRSLDALPNNLPRQLTSFIGREKEIAEVKRLLSTACIVTLTGPGGAGKTRLALHVGADLLDTYRDGVWWVELASLSNPALVPAAVASALDVPEQPGRPLEETLVRSLPPKQMLLVLDNCEHLLSACRDLADALLRACPHLRILATSREAVGVDGEVTYRVPSLQLPDLHLLPPPATLVHYEAIRLFAERAALSQPGFNVTASNAAAVAQICHRLDGIPLAIEFAAARVKVLSVDQIAARLDDRFRLLTAGARKTLPRHQTLRATMDWSHDLLSEQERTVLRRLSVFAGGWTLDAAEAICAGDGVEAADILDRLTQLVDKSLVVAETRNGEARYRLLETIRQYGRDKLLNSGEVDGLRRRHRDWCLALAEQAWPELRGPRAESWLARLETEHDNLRAALQWSKIDKDGAEAGLRLAGALFWFWVRHDHWSEGLAWTEGALARSSEAPPSALPRALAAATQFAWRRGDYGRARAWGEKGLALCRDLADGDMEARAILLHQISTVASRQGDYKQALALADECLNVVHDLADKWLYGQTLVYLGILARGDDQRATTYFTQALAAHREAGDKWGIAHALSRFARDVSLRQRHYDQAAASFAESLILCGEAGTRWVSEECLEGLARVASATGHYERAARLFGAAEVLRETVGWVPDPHDQADHDQYVASARAGLAETAFAAAWDEGRAMTLEQAIEYALAES